MKDIEWLARCPYCSGSFEVTKRSLKALAETATRLEDHLVDGHAAERKFASEYGRGWAESLAGHVPNEG